MPGIFDLRSDRRRFLQTSFKALAAGALVSRVAGESPDQSQFLRWALLSDTHLAADPKTEYRKFLPAENLRRAVKQVLEAQPEAALINGDVARLTGELEDYSAAKGLLEPIAAKCPIYLGLGNHDDREKFNKVFPWGSAVPVKDKRVLVVEAPFLRVIVLDSLLFVNKVPGLLGKNQREWLDKHLASADARPTVLFVHHTLGEGDGELLDAGNLLRIVQPYAKVKAIFYGHSHQYNFRMRNGIHLVNLPAVGYNFSDTEPVGWVDARFSARGVDLTLKALGGDLKQDGQTTSLNWRTT